MTPPPTQTPSLLYRLSPAQTLTPKIQPLPRRIFSPGATSAGANACGVSKNQGNALYESSLAQADIISDESKGEVMCFTYGTRYFGFGFDLEAVAPAGVAPGERMRLGRGCIFGERGCAGESL